ncbi:glutamyl-tRNA reductase [Microbacterium sp. STN6]|uniref:glutamyl-tRNA reductase n=1 Tax=Microbacterium sp. STN6 TaxID=2995588 RepID=UPI002260F0D0|nr:glutamyl-tRNA reductase [Microbacterium sp. STN6]MCX7522661.1 glutamyl-tRNA reductase [Microbacterium sp. STN6]
MLLCFTSSHRTAGFDMLERLERRAPEVAAAIASRDELVNGSVVLATCNRFEAYLDIDEPLTGEKAAAVAAVLEAVGQATDIGTDELREASAVKCGDDAAAHLFAVSSGLESVVVGEGEIAGQVRRALESARSNGTVTSELERLFQDASRTSRGVKNRTGITSAGRSVVRLALDMAESRVTDWARTRVLLVGTGAYAGASLAALRDRGVTDVRVYSRTGRAHKFAATHDIDHVPGDGLAEAVAASDLVVTCSVAPTVILDASLVSAATHIAGALERRLVIDLGLPRNVDPAVALIDGVELLDLETISKHAPLAELNATDEARALVGEAVAEFQAKAAEQAVTPALVALRRHVFDVLDGEIEWARRRGDSSAETEAALRHLAGVLLHTPSVRARELARGGEADAFIDGVAALFGVEADAAAAAAADTDGAAAADTTAAAAGSYIRNTAAS